ncbi:MAG TPA: MurT ligase domain-containing protein [Mycobacteriales bacterium]|nr:MurT ligase domain-containing protein [Mycobacteriales bacterium]
MVSSARAAAANGLGRLAARTFRAAGRAGGIVGGRVALAVDRGSLARLAAGRTVALVSGTNGKTTTTAMLARALRRFGPVASNSSGANMPDGLVAALLDGRDAPTAVLEVDEAYLAEVARQISPQVAVLLNLSRDQLDRAGEVRRLEGLLRQAFRESAGTVVVANPDDVLVASAALVAGRRAVWVATGGGWSADGAVCPRCGGAVRHERDRWWCSCGLRRPDPDWRLEGSRLTGPDGRWAQLDLRVPGRMNLANAAVAVAAAATLGVPLTEAADAVGSVTQAAGRYRTVPLAGHAVRLMLAKNPAGWTETMDLVLDPDRGLVIAVDGRQSDGRDLSWLWDVPFERLRGRRVTASGGRAADLAVRLAYAEVDCDVVEDPVAGVAGRRENAVDLVASYSCFLSAARLAGAG